MQKLQKLNRQLAVYRNRLLSKVGLTVDEASSVATLVLKDACFENISKRAAPKSVAARCAKHLSRGTVRCHLTADWSMSLPLKKSDTATKDQGDKHYSRKIDDGRLPETALE